MTTTISMIAALDENRVIGNKGGLPWSIKKDLKWFSEQTKNKIVVMGRKNYEDIITYTNGNPLPNRTNIIITSKNIKINGFIIVNSLEELFEKYPTEDLIIIGGQTLYEQFLPYSSKLILTEIKGQFPGDTFFPLWDKQNFEEIYRKKEQENNIYFDYVIYQRKLNFINYPLARKTSPFMAGI